MATEDDKVERLAKVVFRLIEMLEARAPDMNFYGDLTGLKSEVRGIIEES